MSADNMICIQKRKVRWVVWMASASDYERKPAKCDAKFYHEADAERYAEDWLEHAFVEHGIVRMSEA